MENIAAVCLADCLALSFSYAKRLLYSVTASFKLDVCRKSGSAIQEIQACVPRTNNQAVCCLQLQLVSWSPLWTFSLRAFHRQTENLLGFTFWCLGMCFHDSFSVCTADKHIQASAWKNSWFSPGIFSKAAYWSSVPRDCFVFPSAIWTLPHPLCSRRSDVGCPEAMGYNQCGQGGKWFFFLLSSAAVSLQYCCQASHSGTQAKGKRKG